MDNINLIDNNFHNKKSKKRVFLERPKRQQVKFKAILQSMEKRSRRNNTQTTSINESMGLSFNHWRNDYRNHNQYNKSSLVVADNTLRQFANNFNGFSESISKISIT